ncbi:MAG: carboxypeptidase-like regulatory domain-containing protein, partial [Terriglobales bacterium]
MNSRFFIPLLALSLQVSATAAQQTPTPANTVSRAILGTVLDPSGAVIPNAQVSLTGPDGSRTGETQTDERGSFHFDSVTPNRYRILVQATGFQDANTEVSVGTKTATSVRIIMAIAAQAESVTVGGTDLGAQV